MIVRQQASRLDPFLLQVVYPYAHALGWQWLIRLIRACNRTEVPLTAQEHWRSGLPGPVDLPARLAAGDVAARELRHVA